MQRLLLVPAFGLALAFAKFRDPELPLNQERRRELLRRVEETEARLR